MSDFLNADERSAGAAAGALAGMPALLGECHLMAEEMERASTRMRFLRTKLIAGISAITGTQLADVSTINVVTLQITLPARRFDAIERLIDAIQARDQGMTCDDALADIFEAGMTSMTLRLARLSERERND